MKPILLAFSLLLLAGCQTHTFQGTQLQALSQNSNDPYAAVRQYEQNHGLYDWRNSPPVT